MLQPSVSGSLISRLTKGQTTNSTTASFLVAVSRPTTTEPVGSATRTVIRTGGGAFKDSVTLKVTPYGGDANNDIINVKVQGWHSVPVTGATTTLYVPHCVCEAACTLSNALPGIATMPVVATEFFCDTVAITQGYGVAHNGVADKDVAWFECDVSSFEYVEILFSMGTGGDQANALYRF